jgi:hypothetical protein
MKIRGTINLPKSKKYNVFVDTKTGKIHNLNPDNVYREFPPIVVEIDFFLRDIKASSWNGRVNLNLEIEDKYNGSTHLLTQKEIPKIFNMINNNMMSACFIVGKNCKLTLIDDWLEKFKNTHKYTEYPEHEIEEF